MPTPQSSSPTSGRNALRDGQTMSAKENSKFEDLAKRDQACYDREKAVKKEKKENPNVPKRPPSAFSYVALSIAQRPKMNTQACLLEIVQRNGVRRGLPSLTETNNYMSRKQLG